MEQKTEKRMIKGYEITQGIHIGGKEVVFGINEKKKEWQGQERTKKVERNTRTEGVNREQNREEAAR